jgi:hypothetical protein
VIYEASFSGFLHSFEIVVICMVLTLAEFVAVALLVAPVVARKLLSPARAPAACTANRRWAITAS